MTLRFIANRSAALAWLVTLVPPLWMGVANAQAPEPAASMPAPAAPGFRSALEDYQPYTEEKIRSWKEANDTTGRIGGWRAYAKEAQQPAAPDTATRPAPNAGQVKP